MTKKNVVVYIDEEGFFEFVGLPKDYVGVVVDWRDIASVLADTGECRLVVEQKEDGFYVILETVEFGDRFWRFTEEERMNRFIKELESFIEEMGFKKQEDGWYR